MCKLLTKKFEAKARLTEISVNDLIGHWHLDEWHQLFGWISEWNNFQYIVKISVYETNGGMTQYMTGRGVCQIYCGFETSFKHGRFDMWSGALTYPIHMIFEKLEIDKWRGKPWRRGRLSAIGDLFCRPPGVSKRARIECKEDGWFYRARNPQKYKYQS